MGNSPQKQVIVEAKVGDYNYQTSRKLQLGILPHLLSRSPKAFLPVFPCQKCGRENFDGGLCQKVHCVCGALCSRQSAEDPSSLPAFQFWDNFDICNSKRYAEINELETLTIGIFQRGLPRDFSQSTPLDCSAVFTRFLHPFFTDKMRCLSNKDCFKSTSAYFKVMNCNPAQGFVTQRTMIFCHEILSDRSLFKIEITPLAPHIITEELFESLILPHFRTSRHVHQDQILNINGLECVISKSEPNNGVLTPDSRIEYQSSYSPQLERLKLVPYFEDLPISLKSLESNVLVQSIVSNYLIPFLKGWSRTMFPGKVVSIAGIDFKVLETSPNKGVISDSTVIFYDGKGISRRDERRHERATIPRNNRIILRQILTMLDSMKQLTEEFSEVFISTLPVFVLDVIPESSEQKCCLICMNDFEKGDEVRALPCCKF